MGKIKFIHIILMILLFSSCFPLNYITPTDVKKRFAYCYNPENKIANQLLRYDGYYSFDTFNDTVLLPMDNIIFYSDGSIVRMIMGVKLIHYGKDEHYLDSTFNYVSNCSDSIISNFLLWSYYNKGAWGQYRISNDTIKTEVIFKPDPGYFLGLNWFFEEHSYKIIDKNTIKIINPEFYEKNIIGRFVPVKNIPPPEYWLTKERWYWCNKQAFDSLMVEPTKKEKRKESRNYKKMYKRIRKGKY